MRGRQPVGGITLRRPNELETLSDVNAAVGEGNFPCHRRRVSRRTGSWGHRALSNARRITVLKIMGYLIHGLSDFQAG
jgi:hypothetical protein